MLNPCRICPRNCGVNRMAGETGYCGAGLLPEFEDYYILGSQCPGSVFFHGCNLRCRFCIFPFFSLQPGPLKSIEDLSNFFLMIQRAAISGINLLTPTIWTPQILAALPRAIERGLRIPFAWNSSSYESLKTLKILEGVVDIFVPDLKFSDPDISKKLADTPHYFEVAKRAVIEMHRQVGDLVLNPCGAPQRGVLLKHLLLPNSMAGTAELAKFVASEIAKNTFIEIIGAYEPPSGLPEQNLLSDK